MKIKIPYKSCNLSSKQIETIKRKIRQKQKTQKIKTKPKSQVTKYIKQLKEKQKNKKSIITYIRYGMINLNYRNLLKKV